MTNQKQKITKKIVKEKRDLLVMTLFSIIVAVICLIIYKNFIIALVALIVGFSLAELFVYFKKRLDESAKIKKMEEIFPDFIELMASNLRAGMTIDKALLMSSRKEFSPLDSEILSLGKDILTGKEITLALNNMSQRIKSNKISKTIDLINSGIKSGGNLSILLEETAVSMRERLFIEKKAASNVLMYVIFIFFATSIGAPILYALSSVLVEIMTKLLANSNISAASDFTSRVPFAFSEINISTKFIAYFSVLFLLGTNLLASLMLGITNKGEEKEGLKYFIPMAVISILVYLIVRLLMVKYLVDLIA